MNQNITKIHDFSNGSHGLSNISWLMDMYILNKGLGLEWHVYFLTKQLD
jgi:hypothetical protein